MLPADDIESGPALPSRQQPLVTNMPAASPTQDERMAQLVEGVRKSNGNLCNICWMLVFILFAVWGMQSRIDALAGVSREELAVLREMLEEMRRNHTVYVAK